MVNHLITKPPICAVCVLHISISVVVRLIVYSLIGVSYLKINLENYRVQLTEIPQFSC